MISLLNAAYEHAWTEVFKQMKFRTKNLKPVCLYIEVAHKTGAIASSSDSREQLEI